MRRARIYVGLSQYDLAGLLGWPRAKVKRIEKHEVASIDAADLREFCKCVALSSTVPKPRAPRKAKGASLADAAAAEAFAGLGKGAGLRKADSLRGVATLVRVVGAGPASVVATVQLRSACLPQVLIGRLCEVMGRAGFYRVQGVWNTKAQERGFARGERVSVLLRKV